jgi:leucyl-tRNA synthetase
VADYVLMGYGTGAIMAVPAHDQRDFEFARQLGLPIRGVVRPTEAWLARHGLDADEPAANWPEPFVDDGEAMNSANAGVSLDGLPTPEAKRAIVDWLESAGHGKRAVSYRLRDWLFSRQRYWGEPIPIVWDDDGLPTALPDRLLPVELPPIDDFSPQSCPDEEEVEPKPPLSRVPEWGKVVLDLGEGPKTYRRELNTMPQWAGSCWYYLRYLDPTNDQVFVDPEVERYWMQPNGVDLYIGGVEHAVLHLLYARFWHKMLYDLGHVSTPEPFGRLFNQGYIQAAAYTDERGMYVPAAEVTKEPDGSFFWAGHPVRRQYGKMGKSLKNSVSPDDIYQSYGADTLRLYEMAMGPFDADRPWNTRDIIGVHRFLQRVWRNLIDEESGRAVVAEAPTDAETVHLLHRTIAAVRTDLETLRFNTAIARLIELNNHLTQIVQVNGSCPRSVAEPLVLMLAPLAPHIAEELWGRLDHKDSLAYKSFPEANPAFLVEKEVEIPVQIGRKVRFHVQVSADADAEELRQVVMADEQLAHHLKGQTVERVVAVPGKLINVVVR